MAQRAERGEVMAQRAERGGVMAPRAEGGHRPPRPRPLPPLAGPAGLPRGAVRATAAAPRAGGTAGSAYGCGGHGQRWQRGRSSKGFSKGRSSKVQRSQGIEPCRRGRRGTPPRPRRSARRRAARAPGGSATRSSRLPAPLPSPARALWGECTVGRECTVGTWVGATVGRGWGGGGRPLPSRARAPSRFTFRRAPPSSRGARGNGSKGGASEQTASCAFRSTPRAPPPPPPPPPPLLVLSGHAASLTPY